MTDTQAKGPIHINQITGKIGKCRATKQGCPLKNEEGEKAPHFETQEEAQNYLNKDLTEKHGIVATKSKKTPSASSSTPQKQMSQLLDEYKKNEEEYKKAQRDVRVGDDLVEEYQWNYENYNKPGVGLTKSEALELLNEYTERRDASNMMLMSLTAKKIGLTKQIKEMGGTIEE